MNNDTHDNAHDNAHDIDPAEWQAYLDDELDADARARIDAAIASDPELAARLARDRGLQARVRDAFADVLDEPVPAHLLGLLAAGPGPQASATPSAQEAPNVIALPQRDAHRRMPPAWLGYAAAAVLAVVAIGGVWQRMQSPVRMIDGELVAGGPLAKGLDTLLASAPDAASAVSIGLSFRARDGRVCRSFTYREDTALSGLACRHGHAWRLSSLGRAPVDDGGEWSQASVETTPELQAAIEAMLADDALDAAGERAARDAGWR